MGKLGVSIHLMLLFIAMDKYGISLTDSFQYISCYSLSISGATGQEFDDRFNTSHVTLYLRISYRVSSANAFQYISCYSLSITLTSIYSLFLHVSIHLMLLFIYVPVGWSVQKSCFNTSHVTLYRQGNCGYWIRTKFQYISCYSLSEAQKENFISSLEFQYISCYSLSTAVTCSSSHVSTFQYISCYSLSFTPLRIMLARLAFQYISCYSLSFIGIGRMFDVAKFQYISCYSLSLVL